MRTLIETAEPCVSPIVELELTFLHEVGRVTEPATAPLAALRRSIGLRVHDVSLAELVPAARNISWTRDPFDRLVAAQAVVADVPLVTADRMLLEHLPQATWD